MRERRPVARAVAEAGRKTMFQPGARVVLVGHWEFEDGIVGTVANPPDMMVELAGKGEWSGCRRVFTSTKGSVVSYYVVFDEPHDDGSGDGPYSGAEIDEGSLKPLIDR
jgi:hypothetical protein